jgi:hypothetical protein
MSKPKKQKDYNPLSAVSGVMECEQQHRWKVKDLNPERKAVSCPICGGYTSISQGLTKDDGPKR